MSNYSTWKRSFLLATYTLHHAQQWMESGVKPDLRLPEFDDIQPPVSTSHGATSGAASGASSDDEDATPIRARKSKVTTIAPTISLSALTPVRRYTVDETDRTMWKEDRSTQSCSIKSSMWNAEKCLF